MTEPVTVGELRNVLQTLPDDIEVVVLAGQTVMPLREVDVTSYPSTIVVLSSGSVPPARYPMWARRTT